MKAIKVKNLKNLILLSAIICCCFSSAYAQDACSNVSLNKSAIASSSTSTEIPSLAFDGDLTTNWCAPGSIGWIQVDLQNKVTINSLKLYVNQYYAGNTVHEIKISSDMVSWTLVKTLSGYTSNNQVLTVNFSPALSDVRGVMINTTSSNSWVSWYEIQVFSNPVKPIITQNRDVLTSSSTTNNQWYLDGSPIPGENSQSYTATAIGSYQVGVSNGNGCESMSDIVNVTSITAGVNEIAKKDVKIYPNPAKDNISIEGVTSGKIELINLQGQVINYANVSDKNKSMDISKLATGVYSLKITTDEGIIVKKLLKQ